MTPPSQPLARTANQAAALGPRAAARSSLTDAQRDLLWMVAQHKYGWTHCGNLGGRVRWLQVARALERRGLVWIDLRPVCPVCSATEAGRAEIARRWPVSPFILGTYEHQPGGWTPLTDDAPPSLCARCGIRAVALQGYCEGCWELRADWRQEG